MNVAEQLDRVEQLLLAGRLNESTSLLHSVESDLPALQRKKIHMQGKLAFASCRYSEASEILESGIQTHGSHVLLKADLLLSYYMQGQHFAWYDNLEGLLKTLHELEFQILPDHWVRAGISCGKLLEESGRIVAAHTLFQQCYARTNATKPWREVALAQILRCAATFFEESEIASHYKKLTLLQSGNDPDLIIYEHLHALLMAEMSLLSQADFSTVLRTMRDKYEILNPDVWQWFLFDLLEIHLLRNRKVPEEISLAVQKIQSPHTYEKALLIIHSDPQSLTLEDIGELSIAPFARVKLWFMIQGHDLGASQRLQIWIKNSEPKEQKLFFNLLARCRSEHSTDQIFIILRDNGQLLCRNEILDFSRRKNQLALLRIFAESEKVEGELRQVDLIQAIWQEDANIYSTDRLRVTANRLNQSLRRFTNGEKALSFGDSVIKLHSKLKIRIER